MRFLLPFFPVACRILITPAISRAQDVSRPNVLLIISDDQAWGDYSFLGHPHIRTPHLDKLAGESLTYTRGYVASPLCRPSLASIFSGKYAHQHGITGNDPRIPPGKKRGRSNPELKPLYETNMDRIDADPGIRDRFLSGIPSRRFGHPDDIRGLSVFLASDASSWITGALIPMDGGNLAQNAGGSHGNEAFKE